MLDTTLAPVPDTSARRMLVDRVAAARASGDARRIDIAERTLAGFDARQREGFALLASPLPAPAPSPEAAEADALVTEACRELGVPREDTTTATAWAVAFAWERRGADEGSYTRAAWQGLALALLEGDAARVAECALWIVRPAEAIARQARRLSARPAPRSTEDLCRETIARHPATVALAQRLPRLAAAIAVGAILTVVDVAVMSERADAARDAWIAAVEAEGEADLPELPGSLAWTPSASALVPAVGA